MKSFIELYPPVAIHEIGRRENNEDSIYPGPGQTGSPGQLFVVCDGVGGSVKGEVASSLACTYYPEFFHSNMGIHDHQFIENAVRHAEEKVSKYIHENPECQGMSTTLTSLSFHGGGTTIAWIGDSRVYHVRDGQILFQTKDHSLVNLLIDQGQITKEEAATHPRRNVIRRVLRSSDKPAKPETYLVDDVRPDDYFLLCTDGLLENIKDKVIQENLTASADINTIKDTFLQLAFGKTKDNFSMYLIKVKGC